MQSWNIEMNITTKSEHETTEYANLKAYPPPAVEKIALHPKEKYLSPSSSSNSSSPDSPLDDPFNNDDDDRSISSTECEQIPKKEEEEEEEEEEASVVPHSEIEAPQNQTMEYSIPCSVFETSQSDTPPMELSVAANESLFSMHAEQLLWRSGDLGASGGETSTSDHMFSYSSQQSKCAEMRIHELGLAEATMKEVIRESESHNYVTAQNYRRSQGSGTSTKSFAFSIKAGDLERDTSSRIPSSVRSSPGEKLMKVDPKQSTYRDKKTPAPTRSSAHSKLFSCFSCCTFW